MKTVRLILLLGAALTILGIAYFAPSFETRKPASSVDPDVQLVRSLLSENLSDRTFSFATIAEATSGKKVIPLDNSEPHKRVVAAIESALSTILPDLSQPETPIQSLAR
ncbi:MAG TPA: hypothetical protein VM511_11385, partial [Luteolibacter sp.]|nr:hypothetical protein [Luteolibacter sp.]